MTKCGILQVAVARGTVLRPFWADAYRQLVSEEFKSSYPSIDWPEDALSLLPQLSQGDLAEEQAMELNVSSASHDGSHDGSFY